MEKRKWHLRVAAAAFSFCFTFLLVEVLLRSAWNPPTSITGWKWRGSAKETNWFGYRGNRNDGDKTVILLGDSQVETIHPLGKLPEVFLQEELRKLTGEKIRVVTIGASGWGQDQQLLAIREYIGKLKPKVICLWFTQGNDLWNNTFPTHFPRNGLPKPTFWLENGQLKGPHANFMEPYNKYTHSLYWMRLFDVFLGVPPFVTDEEWEKRLPPAYRFNGNVKDAPSLRNHLAGTRKIKPEDLTTFSQENFVNEKTHYSIYFYPPSPRLRYSVELTNFLLKEIQKTSQDAGADFLIFYTEIQRPPSVPSPMTFEANGTLVTMWSQAGVDRINETLRGFQVLPMRDLPVDFVTSARDSHLNEEGNRHVMERLAAAIQDNLH